MREIRELGAEAAEERISKIVEERLREEIKRGVQTIQYQVVTLMTTQRPGTVHHGVHVPR